MLLRALMCQKWFQQLYHLVPLQLRENSLIQPKTEPKVVQSYCWGSFFTSEHFVSVSFCLLYSHSVVWLFETPWTAAHQASLSFTISRSLPKLMSIELMMPFNHLILCRPLLLLLWILPSIRIFSNESALRIRWPKYWSFSFSFSISPSNEYSGLISFRMDLLVVQENLKSLLQHQNSKALILWLSAFFMVQLSHPYIATGKTISLTIDLYRPLLAIVIHQNVNSTGFFQVFSMFCLTKFNSDLLKMHF